MAKLTRERTVKERRARKREKKEEKKAARSALSADMVDDETRSGPAPSTRRDR